MNLKSNRVLSSPTGSLAPSYHNKKKQKLRIKMTRVSFTPVKYDTWRA